MKNIEDIKVGDFVLSKDPNTGKTDYKPAVNTFIVQHTELFILIYKDANGDEYELKVSGEHPFWVSDKGWISARDLAIADKLLINDDAVVEIINITIEKAEPGKTFTTYNFEVDDFHTYYVLQEGKKDSTLAVLVHNTTPCGQGSGPNFEQYSLRALEDGWYPVMKRGSQKSIGEVFLKAGEIWKIGTTKNPLTRYTQKFLTNTGKGLRYVTEYEGDKAGALFQEFMKLRGHVNTKGRFPGGNKVFK